MKFRSRWLTGFGTFLIVLVAISQLPASADEKPHRVLIQPLVIHSEKDLAFLNKGILEMMVSRIGPSATVIGDTAPEPGKTPIQRGHDLKADYVVTGSVTIFGNSVSTDAVLTRVDTGEPALQFSQFGQSGGDVLMHVNQFATQVNQYLASLVTPTAPPATPPPAIAATPPPLVQTVVPTAPAAPRPVTEPAPPVATSVGTPSPPPEPTEALWTSPPVKGIVSALAVGDVDGNGQPDIVFIHENQVVVETKKGPRIDTLATFGIGSQSKLIAIDAADINHNQVAEIFVTCLDPHDRLDSFVLEWNGTSIAAIATGLPWYFRIENDPQNGPVLLGQRRGTPSANDTGGLYSYTHFLPGIFELTPAGNAYQPGRRVPLPDDQAIYRFTRGNIFNDGKIRAIAYTSADKLRVYDPAGSPQWAGEETLGGNPLFLESVSSTDIRTKDKTYLTQRLVVVDLDGDGAVEVVTAHNRDAAMGFVERFRKYTRGRMLALRWNKLNMKTVWNGEDVSGYISDFAVADIDGDGRAEAVYAMVTSSGILQGNSSSIVVEQIGSLSEK